MLLVGCSSATSIQDLGWEQQSTLSAPNYNRQQAAQPAAPPYVQPNPYGAPIYQPQAQAGQYAAPQPAAAYRTAAAPDPQKIRVALLLPMSGPHSALGQSLANAAQLAVFDMGVNDFELLPRDTKGSAHGAVRAARDAIASGAQLIVGPLFAASVSAVKPVVLASQINMLGLSTDMSLATPRVYMMGFAPNQQINRLVDYAAERGKRRYAAMIPPGPYGMLARKAFKEAVERTGGVLVVEDLRGDVAPIVAMKDQIDALFIPYGGTGLRRLAAKLTEAGLEHGSVQLLGTGLWDAPNIAGNQDLLIGGWYAAPEPTLRSHFVEGYEASFGKAPPRLATLAYDAIAMSVVLARHQLGYDKKAIEMKTGFAGVDGLFRLKADGKVERGLAINSVTYEGGLVIDASPKTFAKPAPSFKEET